jgi:hypothetical protein
MPCADLFSKIEPLRKLVKKPIRIVQFPSAHFDPRVDDHEVWGPE